ncbi:MAG TPA: DUF378 domain-containing protein [Candidatus Babeliales bacterium]|nr:DUF378 domain-containing protein [Candidatus Babeliales bacterium]
MHLLCSITRILAALGALNWGFVTFFNFNLVTWLETTLAMPYVGTISYSIIALSGAYVLFTTLFMGHKQS